MNASQVDKWEIVIISILEVLLVLARNSRKIRKQMAKPIKKTKVPASITPKVAELSERKGKAPTMLPTYIARPPILGIGLV